MRRLVQQGFIALIAILLATAMVAPVAMADHDERENGAPPIDTTSDESPRVWVEETDVTIAEHRMGEHGTDPLAYEADDGSNTDLPAEVNTSDADAPIEVSPAYIDDPDLYGPVTDDEANVEGQSFVAEEGDWSVSGSASAKGSVSEWGSAPNVRAAPTQLATDGSMTAGDTVLFSYSDNVSLDDARKRVVTMAGELNTLDSGATVRVEIVDTDGDYAYATIAESAADADEETFANETGAFYASTRVDTLVSANGVQGTGDGTLSEIDTVRLNVTDADADLALTGMDVSAKETMAFGTVAYQADSDDRYETETRTNVDGGTVRFRSLDGLADHWGDAHVHDLVVGAGDATVNYPLSMADGSNVTMTDAEDYASYSDRLEGQPLAVWDIPAPVDVTHGTLDLVAEQRQPGSQYISVDYATGYAGNYSEASTTGATSQFNGAIGDRVELATDISASSDHDAAVGMEIVYTSSEADAVFQEGGTVAGGPTGKSGGFLSTTLGKITGLIGAAITALGLGKIFGGGS
ncbi:hypothetical protein [Haloglomus litoreum]|uniref:hypothetical protein n=1 Tax=Haloglomus litoreum TaxID=3034026 RepID=UPI0023E88330|nr:hypothetical protein [Haloglomus sp. DT116]